MSGRYPPKSINPIYNPNAFQIFSNSSSVTIDTEELQTQIEAIDAQLNILGTFVYYDVVFPSTNPLISGGYTISIIPANGTYLLYSQFNPVGINSAKFVNGSITVTDTTGGQTLSVIGVSTGATWYNTNASFIVTKGTSIPAINITFSYDYTISTGGATYTLNAPPTPALSPVSPVVSIRLMRLA